MTARKKTKKRKTELKTNHSLLLGNKLKKLTDAILIRFNYLFYKLCYLLHEQQRVKQQSDARDRV